MSSNQFTVADQLPDENQIERLFPKCPPKRSASYRQQYSAGRNSRSMRDLRMRQNKCKTQQHLRRESEARRNRVKTSALSTYRDSKDSSDTSDGDNNSNSNHNIRSNSNLVNSNNNTIRKSNSSTQMYDSFAQNPNFSASSSYRKSGKQHLASQSFRQQQLQRSYQSSSLNSNNNITEQPSKLDNKREDISKSSQFYNSTSVATNPQVRRSKRSNTGIIKSASSYIFNDDLDVDDTPPRQQTSGASNQASKPLSIIKSDNKIIDESPEDNLGSVKTSLYENKSLLKNSYKTETPTTTAKTSISNPTQNNSPVNHLDSDFNIFNDSLSPVSQNNSNTNNIVVGRKLTSDGTEDGDNLKTCAQKITTTLSADSSSLDEHAASVKNDFITNNPISIHDSNPPSTTAELIRPILNVHNNISNQESSIQNNDDNYINLFVYDNASAASNNNDERSAVPIVTDKQHSPGSIISIHHQASHQLLITGSNDLGENNDASTEELCSSSDILNETKPNLSRQNSGDICEIKKDILETRITVSKKLVQKESHLSGTLQTVDESIEERGSDVDRDEDAEIGQGNTIVMPQMNAPTRRGFAPPGYPQRIRPQSTDTYDASRITSPIDTEKVKHNNETLLEKVCEINSSQPSVDRITRTEPQRVKFADENLVVIEGDCAKQTYEQVKNKTYETNRRNETQMPIISEAQCESELESNKVNTDSIEQDLSVNMDKISISNSVNIIEANRNEINPQDVYSNTNPKPQTSEKSSRVTDSTRQDPPILESPTCSTTQQNHINDIPLVSNLRHHKLPNETSHYSVIRTTNNNLHPEPSRSSLVQFNNLSDGDSGADESSVTRIRTFAKQRSYSSDRKATNSVNFKNNDDDLLTKTVLVFPRIDEGLSSEPESCDDEVDDEDERAMDADVEGDDDDEDDADDDIESDSPLARGTQTMHLNQNTSDMGSSSMHQVKGQGSSYVSSYLNHETTSEGDIKSNMINYLNQNVQANYWIGTTSQSPSLGSQLPSSQQMNLSSHIPANQHMRNQTNNSLTKPNNTLNRDEAKTASRLSSDTDNETDRLLGFQRNDQLKLNNNEIASSNPVDLQPVNNSLKQNANSREVLIEGVLFNVKYLGSTHTDCEGRSEKEDRIHQAEMAVHEVKFRNGDSQQAATEVQLFISTEKIMVLDDKHRKIMMDHSLRTISYIADIGDAIVLIVRKKSSNSEMTNELGRPISKISCHVFESSESHTITKSISQAFQVAYTELLKANGTGDTSSYLPKELDYQEVLNSQEMSTDELEMFARKENQREVIVPKEKGEILGLSIVESGWGSVLPTVVIASLKHDGPAYRCKKLSVGDQILSVNGISLVGLPLAECQEILRKTRKQRVARLSVVPCPITVEVKIKRPDTKYQLGFSVQNGVICSLLRGGIAERGGVRVGHRIMSINGTTVVGVPHEKIVTLLASSVGEIRMKTCLTSLYRLILGEENPVHF